MILLALTTIALGAVSQRVTGMGLALVAAPFLLLLLDPLTVVIIVNICGMISAVVISTRMHRQIDWRRYVWLTVPALVGIVPGSLLLFAVSDAWLKIGIGAVLVLSLVVATKVRQASTPVDGPMPLVLCGFSSGFMNAAAGTGGPAFSVYAVLSHWDQRSFAATAQPYLFTIAGASVLSKILIDPGSWPALDWWFWLGVALALVVGLMVGDALSSRVNPRQARVIVVILAYVGAVSAIVKGLFAL